MNFEDIFILIIVGACVVALVPFFLAFAICIVGFILNFIIMILELSIKCFSKLFKGTKNDSNNSSS